MILHFGAHRTARDVDALLLRGNSAELRHAVSDVVRRLELGDNWLNDAVKGFADVLPADFATRLVPLEMRLQRLKIYVLGRADQIALKIVALREQDFSDLELLSPVPRGRRGPHSDPLDALPHAGGAPADA